MRAGPSRPARRSGAEEGFALTGRLAAGVQGPLTALLGELLSRLTAELPGVLGASVSVRDDGGPPRVAAAHGLGAVFATAQLAGFGGPVPTATRTGEAVVTADVFTDERWPALTLTGTTEHHPGLAAEWLRVRGVVALPVTGDALVLSVTLDRPATTEAITVVRHYATLAALAFSVADAARADQAEEMLEVLQSRAALEEAKGIVIALRRCSSDEAWATLRRASQEFNVKARELAVALVELLAGAPAPQPGGDRTIQPGSAARAAAEQVLLAFEAEPVSRAKAGL